MYAYNSSNQLTSLPGATFTYDNNGNQASTTNSYGTFTRTWDFENRLTSATINPSTGTSVTFKYDPFGRRIQKSSSTQGTTVYVYDGANIVEETDASGTPVARYTQGLGIDEPLAMLRSGSKYFYHADGLGPVSGLRWSDEVHRTRNRSSVTSLTNTSGTVARTYVYDSFGQTTASTGTVTNPFRYTAREFDPETDFYYYRARYYDRATGRFLSEDPARFLAAANFYAYVANNPLNFADPSGRFPTPWHRQMTYELAHGVFGPKCEHFALQVADANAKVDDFGGVVGFLKFITFQGEGWAQPGPHFPDGPMLAQLRAKAFSCDVDALGQYLHSVQDSFAHSGWAAFDHFTHFGVPDRRAAQDLKISDMTLAFTERELRRFKNQCLGCCK